MMSDAADIIVAVLAVLTMRAITARLVERCRRIRYNPVEVLQAAKIPIS